MRTLGASVTRRHAGRLTEQRLAMSTDRTYSQQFWSRPPCVAESEIAQTYLTSIVPEVVSKAKEEKLRLGRYSSKPRPLLVCFTSDKEKHAFLKHAKTLRQAGVRCDDHLTRLQQQERQVLSEDLHSALKAKGQAPFFRGSELKYFNADKMHTCKQSQAQKAPAAKS